MRLASNLSAMKHFEGRFEGGASNLASNSNVMKQLEGRFEGVASSLASNSNVMKQLDGGTSNPNVMKLYVR